MSNNKSELARLMRQFDTENEAARRGFSGMAQGTAQHEFITARMENMGRIQQKIEKIVGPEAAARLVVEAMDRNDGKEAR